MLNGIPGLVGLLNGVGPAVSVEEKLAALKATRTALAVEANIPEDTDDLCLLKRALDAEALTCGANPLRMVLALGGKHAGTDLILWDGALVFGRGRQNRLTLNGHLVPILGDMFTGKDLRGEPRNWAVQDAVVVSAVLGSVLEMTRNDRSLANVANAVYAIFDQYAWLSKPPSTRKIDGERWRLLRACCELACISDGSSGLMLGSLPDMDTVEEYAEKRKIWPVGVSEPQGGFYVEFPSAIGIHWDPKTGRLVVSHKKGEKVVNRHKLGPCEQNDADHAVPDTITSGDGDLTTLGNGLALMGLFMPSAPAAATGGKGMALWTGIGKGLMAVSQLRQVAGEMLAFTTKKLARFQVGGISTDQDQVALTDALHSQLVVGAETPKRLDLPGGRVRTFPKTGTVVSVKPTRRSGYSDVNLTYEIHDSTGQMKARSTFMGVKATMGIQGTTYVGKDPNMVPLADIGVLGNKLRGINFVAGHDALKNLSATEVAAAWRTLGREYGSAWPERAKVLMGNTQLILEDGLTLYYHPDAHTAGAYQALVDEWKSKYTRDVVFFRTASKEAVADYAEELGYPLVAGTYNLGIHDGHQDVLTVTPFTGSDLFRLEWAVRGYMAVDLLKHESAPISESVSVSPAQILGGMFWKLQGKPNLAKYFEAAGFRYLDALEMLKVCTSVGLTETGALVVREGGKTKPADKVLGGRGVLLDGNVASALRTGKQTLEGLEAQTGAPLGEMSINEPKYWPDNLTLILRGTSAGKTGGIPMIALNKKLLRSYGFSIDEGSLGGEACAALRILLDTTQPVSKYNEAIRGLVAQARALLKSPGVWKAVADGCPGINAKRVELICLSSAQHGQAMVLKDGNVWNQALDMQQDLTGVRPATANGIKVSYGRSPQGFETILTIQEDERPGTDEIGVTLKVAAKDQGDADGDQTKQKLIVTDLTRETKKRELARFLYANRHHGGVGRALRSTLNEIRALSYARVALETEMDDFTVSDALSDKVSLVGTPDKLARLTDWEVDYTKTAMGKPHTLDAKEFFEETQLATLEHQCHMLGASTNMCSMAIYLATHGLVDALLAMSSFYAIYEARFLSGFTPAVHAAYRLMENGKKKAEVVTEVSTLINLTPELTSLWWDMFRAWEVTNKLNNDLKRCEIPVLNGAYILPLYGQDDVFAAHVVAASGWRNLEQGKRTRHNATNLDNLMVSTPNSTKACLPVAVVNKGVKMGIPADIRFRFFLNGLR